MIHKILLIVECGCRALKGLPSSDHFADILGLDHVTTHRAAPCLYPGRAFLTGLQDACKYTLGPFSMGVIRSQRFAATLGRSRHLAIRLWVAVGNRSSRQQSGVAWPNTAFEENEPRAGAIRLN